MDLKNILITGGAGFIGSHLVRLLVKKYPQTNFYNLDSLTYAADLERVADIESCANYHFLHEDIREEKRITRVFEEYQVDGVFHLAAESHVDNSITNPGVFIDTNVRGTFNLIEAARNLWFNGNYLKKQFKNSRFLHVSTDEVYGSLETREGLFTESTPYAPNSPYSSSKASSDMIVRSYHQTYGMPILITNCSNNFGPDQHPEKLIPKTITMAYRRGEIPVYGRGTNIRDWIYVKDHCEALDLVFRNGNLGETYNIGSRNERTNIEIVTRICKLLSEWVPVRDGPYEDLIRFVEDRKGHDFRYGIDNTKIKKLGWKPSKDFDLHLKDTVNSYLERLEKEDLDRLNS